MKRLWVILGCVLSLVVASAASAAEPIKIGYPIWVGFGPIYLAHSKGFFKAQGVDVDLQVIDDTKVGMAALAAKRIGVEVMDIQAACRTYNILMAEERRVAAALLFT